MPRAFGLASNGCGSPPSWSAPQSSDSASCWVLSASYAPLALRQAAAFTDVRLQLGRYLALALEFELGADILSTAVSPSWDEIGKLGAIAVIRTALNFFLTRELREAGHAVASGASRTDPSGMPGDPAA